MFVGTIHSYCFRILQDHVPRYGSYDVLDDHRHAGLLSREYRNLGLSRLGPRHWAPIRDFIRTVDVIGNELIDPAELDGTPLGECYQAYREMLDRYHFLTFGLIISCTVEALEDPAIFDRGLKAPPRDRDLCAAGRLAHLAQQTGARPRCDSRRVLRDDLTTGGHSRKFDRTRILWVLCHSASRQGDADPEELEVVPSSGTWRQD
jgi:hypothetical protein